MHVVSSLPCNTEQNPHGISELRKSNPHLGRHWPQFPESCLQISFIQIPARTHLITASLRFHSALCLGENMPLAQTLEDWSGLKHNSDPEFLSPQLPGEATVNRAPEQTAPQDCR